MTETIQQLKEDIAILQEKLQKLEEQDPEMLLLRQGKVDFVDYDRKKYIRIEYTDSFAGEYSWYVRRIGEDAIRPVRDVNVYASLEELYQKEVVKQKDDYHYKIADEHGETNPYKQGLNMIKKDKKTEELMTSKGYEKNSAGFWEPKPQSEEEVEEGLREAFREAVKQGVVSSVNKPTDDFMDKMVDELKEQNLTDIIWNWWENVFRTNSDWSAENSIEHLVDLIEAFLPKPQSADGSQNVYVECAVEGYNDAIKQIKSKLR